MNDKNNSKKILQNGILRNAGLTPPNNKTDKHISTHHTYKRNKTVSVNKHQQNNKSKELKKLFNNWLNSQE